MIKRGCKGVTQDEDIDCKGPKVIRIMKGCKIAIIGLNNLDKVKILPKSNHFINFIY